MRERMKIIKKTLFIICILFVLFGVSAVHAEDLNDTCVNATDAGTIYPDNTFNELQGEIFQADSILQLNKSYKFDSDWDGNYIEGIWIERDIHIIGKNNSISIDGNGKARGFAINSYCNVVLENLTFINGYSTKHGAGIQLYEHSNLTLINCIFKNNYVYNSDGAALNADFGTNVEIHDCLFSENTAVRETTLEWSQLKCGMGSGVCIDPGSVLKIYDTIFRQNVAHMSTILVVSNDDRGIIKTSTLYMKNCLLEGNVGTDCGIIYLDELGEGEIHDSTFKNNVITNYGGTVELDASYRALVKNCQFIENAGAVGGGIHVKVFNDNYISNVEVDGCTFTKNHASKSGGAIYSNHGIVKISNSNFDQNTADKYGGAVCSNNGNFVISNSNFNQNSALSGGALFIDNSQCSVQKSTFTKNKASERAGAVYGIDGVVNIAGSKFNENSAYRGGASFLKRVTSTISSSSFINNKASERGGAIHFSDGQLSVSGSQFSQNSAQEGGSLFLDESKISVLSTSFANNKATIKGGAVYSKIEDITSSGCSYSGNTAPTGPIVFGSFHANVQQYVTSPKSVVLKIKISSPWKITPSQQIKVTISGAKSFSSKWVKTNSKGEVTITVPYNIKIGKCKIEISIKSGLCYVKSWKKVKDTAKLKAPKSAKKSSGLKIKVLGKNSNQPIKNTKFKVKVGGKAMKLKTNSKGVLKIPSNKLSKGTKKITVKLKNGDYNINSKCSVKIK